MFRQHFRIHKMTEEQELDLAGRIIGLAMKVHRTLGPGFLESVYENALCLELQREGLVFERQKALHVQYEGGRRRDFVSDLMI